tara:strand:+ start:3000 stop:3752 length:753 start_codon:yes stop_codon:yes gene_type:complete
MQTSNPDVKENLEANQPESQEEVKPLFGGTDSQGKERLFNNTEEAQQSWQSAQNFIKDKVDETKTMEARIQELEAKLNQSTKLEDALSQLKNKEESPVNELQPSQTTETTPQLDVETLKQQLLQEVMGSLSTSQQQEVFSKNQNESIGAAQAIYGDSFEEKLRESAKDLGMSDEDIIKEAQANPKRFKKLFGLDKQPKTTYNPSNSVSGFTQKKESGLDLSRGFNDRTRVNTAIDNYRKIAEKQGVKLTF